MFRKIAYHLSIFFVTMGSFYLANANVQEGKQIGDFIITAQGINVKALAQSQQYVCEILDPSILFKPKNKGETKELTSAQFSTLWEKGQSFYTNAPNATLVFSDQKENSYQMIFEIPKAESVDNILALTATPLTPHGSKAFLKNNQPISAEEFIEGAHTAKKETISLLVDDTDEPDYSNPWAPN